MFHEAISLIYKAFFLSVLQNVKLALDGRKRCRGSVLRASKQHNTSFWLSTRYWIVSEVKILAQSRTLKWLSENYSLWREGSESKLTYVPWRGRAEQNRESDCPTVKWHEHVRAPGSFARQHGERRGRGELQTCANGCILVHERRATCTAKLPTMSQSLPEDHCKIAQKVLQVPILRVQQV